MNACPICRAAWPNAPLLNFQHAVCPACFAAFQLHENQWKQVPPGWKAAEPIPFPLGTVLRLRAIEYRVVGFASYSYEVEYGRDQWETYERHEYTLVDAGGGNPRLLCWTSSNWFLARPVDPSQVLSKNWADAEFEGRSYRRQQPSSFTSQRACGYLTHPFRWRELVSISDFVSDRHVIAHEQPGRDSRWAGEILDPQELQPMLAAAYGKSAPTIPVVAATAAAVSPRPPSSPALRLLGILLAVAVIFGAIGAAAYLYERRTKPLQSHWFACELQPSRAVIAIPAEASRLELNPHLPQGALRYQVRILNKQGAELVTQKDFLDMNPKRGRAELKLPEQAASVETDCSLSVRIAGLPSWPVELRFFP